MNYIVPAYQDRALIQSTNDNPEQTRHLREPAANATIYYTDSFTVRGKNRKSKVKLATDGNHARRTLKFEPRVMSRWVWFVWRMGREFPGVGCEVVFEASEWQPVYCFVQRKPPPGEPPTLRAMVRFVGELGGYIYRARPPGNE